MKLSVKITDNDGNLISETEREFPEIMYHELNTLRIVMQGTSIANLIGGLISIGIDATMAQYHKKALSEHLKAVEK